MDEGISLRPGGGKGFASSGRSSPVKKISENLQLSVNYRYQLLEDSDETSKADRSNQRKDTRKMQGKMKSPLRAANEIKKELPIDSKETLQGNPSVTDDEIERKAQSVLGELFANERIEVKAYYDLKLLRSDLTALL